MKTTTIIAKSKKKYVYNYNVATIAFDKDLIKRIKVYCAAKDIRIRTFATEALIKALEK
jgi:hypothetical protein